jgi:hypothetical protein
VRGLKVSAGSLVEADHEERATDVTRHARKNTVARRRRRHAGAGASASPSRFELMAALTARRANGVRHRLTGVWSRVVIAEPRGLQQLGDPARSTTVI